MKALCLLCLKAILSNGIGLYLKHLREISGTDCHLVSELHSYSQKGELRAWLLIAHFWPLETFMYWIVTVLEQATRPPARFRVGLVPVPLGCPSNLTVSPAFTGLGIVLSVPLNHR